ncbi:MAG: SRPBCC domain-containing protein [Ferruginibacter sp.]
MQQLEIKAALQVLKPVGEVFENIVDPDKMKNYFISQSSGYMNEDASLTWKFPEMDIEFPVTVGKIEKDKYISFSWDGAMDGDQTLIEINLQVVADDITFIIITEKSKPNNEAGIKWLKSNTEGWANFLACLKAWMEYGVHLRKGAFNPSQMPV